jgi:hypothetical protein
MNNRPDRSCIFGGRPLRVVNIGYQQHSHTAQLFRGFDAVTWFLVPHDRRHVFILHSDRWQDVATRFDMCGLVAS